MGTVMPVKSDKQRRAMGAALRGKSTLGIPKKVAKEYLGKADGGMTGSAGRAAPTIATSARHYADGGKVAQDALSRRVQAYKDQMDKTRKTRAAAGEAKDEAKKSASRPARQTRATRAGGEGGTVVSSVARGRHPAKSAGRASGARAASARPTRQLRTASATKPPKKPAKVTVGRDGSVTTTRRTPSGGTTSTKRTAPRRSTAGSAPGSQGRQSKAPDARPAPKLRNTGPATRGGRRRKKAGGLRGVLNKLTEMNRESVKRARAHGNRD